MIWEETLDYYGVLIDEEVKKFFTEAKKAAKAYHPFIGKVYSSIEDFVLRKGEKTGLVQYPLDV